MPHSFLNWKKIYYDKISRDVVRMDACHLDHGYLIEMMAKKYLHLPQSDKDGEKVILGPYRNERTPEQ